MRSESMSRLSSVAAGRERRGIELEVPREERLEPLERAHRNTSSGRSAAALPLKRAPHVSVAGAPRSIAEAAPRVKGETVSAAKAEEARTRAAKFSRQRARVARAHCRDRIVGEISGRAELAREEPCRTGSPC